MERIEEIRETLEFLVAAYGTDAEESALKFLLAEVDRLTVTSENRAAVEREWRRNATEHKNEADALREAASSALCLLVEGPEVVGTVQAVEDARKVLSEALQAAKHPQGTYRLTPVRRTLLERRGWQGQDPVPWLLKQIERDDLGGEG